ncbi:MGH1-like glycoside hydrolase domain-containing protein [Pedobacter mucosus]|uniref:MGH1-like glycoside hydrolase domain-containing protein n=1 Tax=Pedobacter mucosus TaxID=2895286 RepID=UPI001EE3EE65|nr:trehalase family glycosidase [Pedobacter mucosus]UKT65028.1 glycoside hydrolase [Pedobacter mucosus]
MRFDFFVVPGYYRNKVLIPNVLFESGYFPWYADSAKGHYVYRYELEWKDQVYVDVDYQVMRNNTVICLIRCVNRTKLPQNLSLNLMGSMNYPEIWPKNKVAASSAGSWINAVDYRDLKFASPHPKDNLVTDGLMRGETRSADFIGGSALTKRFCELAGNQVSYKIPGGMKKGFITLVYLAGEQSVSRLSGPGLLEKEIVLRGTGKLSTLEVPFDSKGTSSLVLRSLAGDGLELNGIFFSGRSGQMPALEDNQKIAAPEVSADAAKRQLILKYRDASGYYGISWDKALFKIREIRNDELDVFFRKMVHNHVDSILRGNNLGHFENVFIRPLELPAESELNLRCLVTYGKDPNQVRQTIDSLDLFKSALMDSAASGSYLSSGQPYAFSQKLLRAALAENIVYPIYTQRNYIRHFTPGKWWNSLYTWDSGFIALGLNETDLNSALECINAYTTPSGSQSAFIHHGSPVPVQVYALLDALNKTQSKAAAQYFYPRLKRYYAFLSGSMGSSTTRKLSSNILKTWDYFYNSGGWDDYPAQVAVHEQKLESSVTPVITTAQCIRFAKILRMMARATGNRADLPLYDKDIRTFSASLQQYAWNPESGYFSYLRHDQSGKPEGPLRYSDGNDYNMGLDGAYPLMAGICDSAQQSILLAKIFSPRHMWTPSGLGVVDQSAPYFRKDGYWNGSVWMPHQWFMWKTMLDLGRPDLAMQIASTGLEVFKKETDNSYYTFEHYLAQNGRGAGWHQFSGLSTPLLSWYNACYKQGTITTGFEILLQESTFKEDFSGYEGELIFDESTPAHSRSIMVCLNPSKRYHAFFNGKELRLVQPYPGLLYVTLPGANKSGKIIIRTKT